MSVLLIEVVDPATNSTRGVCCAYDLEDARYAVEEVALELYRKTLNNPDAPSPLYDTVSLDQIRCGMTARYRNRDELERLEQQFVDEAEAEDEEEDDEQGGWPTLDSSDSSSEGSESSDSDSDSDSAADDTETDEDQPLKPVDEEKEEKQMDEEVETDGASLEQKYIRNLVIDLLEVQERDVGLVFSNIERTVTVRTTVRVSAVPEFIRQS